MPQAATEIAPIWVTTFCRLRTDRKLSVTKLKKTNITIRVSNGASVRALRLAHRKAMAFAPLWPVGSAPITCELRSAISPS